MIVNKSIIYVKQYNVLCNQVFLFYYLGTGTALAAALKKIQTQIETKMLCKNAEDRVCSSEIQQVIILLSDGQLYSNI